MTRRVVVELQDDIDGGPADESVSFAFEGKSYVIDLSKKNADKFRKAIGPFVASARREASRSSSGSRRATASAGSDVDPKAVRAWAVAHGFAISTRGRVKAEIVEAFKAAGN